MNEEPIISLEIDFSNIFNEVTLYKTNIKAIGKCKIDIYNGEGPLPHFHLYSNDKKFNTCICLYSANYFSHGGKYRDILNSSQRKLLNTFLSEEDPIYGLTRWKILCNKWEEFNPQQSMYNKIKKTDIQPDYSNMSQWKSE